MLNIFGHHPQFELLKSIFAGQELVRPEKVDRMLNYVEGLFPIAFDAPFQTLPSELRESLYREDAIIRSIDDILDGDNPKPELTQADKEGIIDLFEQMFPPFRKCAKLWRLEHLLPKNTDTPSKQKALSFAVNGCVYSDLQGVMDRSC